MEACGLSETHCSALPEQTRLLHASWSSKLLHVLAEVALAALGPHTRLTAPATSPPPPRAPQRLTARHPLCIQLRRGHRGQQHIQQDTYTEQPLKNKLLQATLLLSSLQYLPDKQLTAHAGHRFTLYTNTCQKRDLAPS